MTEEDKELEILKAKRLAEMEKNLAQQNDQEEKETMSGNSDQNKLLPREQIIKKLGYRGLEVLSNAESQFPNETKLVEEKLAELIQSGEIDEVLDGGKLLTLFRSVGIRVRMENKINVEKDGNAGVVESTKAASDVYTPVSGEVIDINQTIVDDPAKINEDPEGAAWFFKLKMKDMSEMDSLMNKDEYDKFAKESGS